MNEHEQRQAIEIEKLLDKAVKIQTRELSVGSVSTFTVTVECRDCRSKHYIYPSGPGYQEYKCGCGKVVRVTS